MRVRTRRSQDVIGIGGHAVTSGGGVIGIDLVYVLDPLAFDDDSPGNYPPDPDEILTIFFSIEEEDEQEEVIYSAIGVVDGPACSSPDGETLVLMDDTILNARVFEVCDRITVGPNFAVMGPNGDRTLRAGRIVEMLDGFAVGVDGKLTVEIDLALTP